MNKSELEAYLGENVSVRLFDGQIVSGCLRKTGEEVFEMDPNLYLPKNLYFMTAAGTNVCTSCLFKVSHVRSIDTLT